MTSLSMMGTMSLAGATHVANVNGRQKPGPGLRATNMESNSARIELDYVRQVGSLPQQSLIRFYEVLAHNLTVSIRTASFSLQALP